MSLRIDTPEKMLVADIDVPDRFRVLDDGKVAELAESMAEIGLMTPIHVRNINDGERVDLVAGNHRLQAARRLGWSDITVSFIDGDEDEFRLWEISENLHRSELTPLEHSEHVAEWIRLTNAKGGQVAQPLKGGQQPADKGMSAASRVLGLERTEVRRATKIDAISPEAKRAARDAGLDTNQSALLKIASAPKEEQVSEVVRIKAAKSEKPTDKPKKPRKRDREMIADGGFIYSNDRKLYSLLCQHWMEAGVEWRRRFVKERRPDIEELWTDNDDLFGEPSSTAPAAKRGEAEIVAKLQNEIAGLKKKIADRDAKASSLKEDVQISDAHNERLREELRVARYEASRLAVETQVQEFDLAWSQAGPEARQRFRDWVRKEDSKTACSVAETVG